MLAPVSKNVPDILRKLLYFCCLLYHLYKRSFLGSIVATTTASEITFLSFFLSLNFNSLFCTVFFIRTSAIFFLCRSVTISHSVRLNPPYKIYDYQFFWDIFPRLPSRIEWSVLAYQKYICPQLLHALWFDFIDYPRFLFRDFQQLFWLCCVECSYIRCFFFSLRRGFCNPVTVELPHQLFRFNF